MTGQVFTLEALQAAHGDALLLHYGTLDNPRLIVIDGGPLGFMTWTIPLLVGTLAYDAIANSRPHAPRKGFISRSETTTMSPVIKLLLWSLALMRERPVHAVCLLQAVSLAQRKGDVASQEAA